MVVLVIAIWNIQAAHLAEIAALKAAHALQLSVAHANAQAPAAQPASGCHFALRVKEKTFKETVAKLDTLRTMGHFGMGSDCPASHQFGWRQPRLIPNVVGSYCEPWWRREAITLVDALLDPGMTGIEWGSGTSSRWLVARLKMLHVVEANKKYADMLLESMKGAGLSHRVKTYVHSYHDAQYIDVNVTDVDFVSVDGRERNRAWRRAVGGLAKSNGAVIVWDNSNRARYQGDLAAAPKHWLRFDTHFPWADDVPIPRDWAAPGLTLPWQRAQEAGPAGIPAMNRSHVNRWLAKDEIRTTVFLTRTLECAEASEASPGF